MSTMIDLSNLYTPATNRQNLVAAMLAGGAYTLPAGQGPIMLDQPAVANTLAAPFSLSGDMTSWLIASPGQPSNVMQFWGVSQTISLTGVFADGNKDASNPAYAYSASSDAVLSFVDCKASITLNGCAVRNAAWSGITVNNGLAGGGNVSITNCRVFRYARSAISAQSIAGSGTFTVSNNWAWRQKPSVMAVSREAHVYDFTGLTSPVVNGNACVDAFGEGMQFTACTAPSVSGFFCSDCAQNVIKCDGVTGGGSFTNIRGVRMGNSMLVLVGAAVGPSSGAFSLTNSTFADFNQALYGRGQADPSSYMIRLCTAEGTPWPTDVTSLTLTGNVFRRWGSGIWLVDSIPSGSSVSGNYADPSPAQVRADGGATTGFALVA